MNTKDQPVAHCLTCRCPLSWDSKYSIIKPNKFAKPEFMCHICVHAHQQAMKNYGIKITANHCSSLVGADYYEAWQAYQNMAKRINRHCKRLGRPLTDVEFARLYQQMEAHELAISVEMGGGGDGYYSFLAAVKHTYQIASVNDIP